MGSQSNYRSAQVAPTAEAATRLLVCASGTLFDHQWSWIKPTNQVGPGRLSVDFGPPRCPVANSWCASPASTPSNPPPIDLGAAITGLDRPALRRGVRTRCSAVGSIQHTDVIIELSAAADLADTTDVGV